MFPGPSGGGNTEFVKRVHKVLTVTQWITHIGPLKENVYQGGRDKLIKQALNDRIIMSREEISVEEIRKSISAWKKWLRLVLEGDRSHIEHRLK